MLPDGLCRSHAQALHLWLELPAGIREEEFVAMAHRRGVAVAQLEALIAESSFAGAKVPQILALARVARDELGFTVVGLGAYNREFARELRAAAAELTLAAAQSAAQVAGAWTTCPPWNGRSGPAPRRWRPRPGG